jgi:hypothetical protein
VAAVVRESSSREGLHADAEEEGEGTVDEEALGEAIEVDEGVLQGPVRLKNRPRVCWSRRKISV